MSTQRLSTDDALKLYLDAVSDSIRDGAFVKLSLGGYRGQDETLRNVYARLVTIKGADHLSFTYRHHTRDVVKNLRIKDCDATGADIVIALHACDTATDEALYKAVSAKASIIICAPCCHKELRPQITPPAPLAGVLKHGILLEREAELVTDGLRALLLEAHGYATKVFEFISTEHTQKNLMLVALRRAQGTDTTDASEQVAALKALFGIRTQRLEELLRTG